MAALEGNGQIYSFWPLGRGIFVLWFAALIGAEQMDVAQAADSPSASDEEGSVLIDATQPSDEKPAYLVRQPSLVSPGGMLNKNEHAFLGYIDGVLIPPAIMVAYRYGLFYWWQIGLDVGGNAGVFQSLFHFKMENMKTRRDEFFYWGFIFNTGYKYHDYRINEDLFFEDKSWIYDFRLSYGFRLGKAKEKVIYVYSQFYIDQDLHTPRRQNDYYFTPVAIGWETVVGKYGNFFVEGGYVHSINGMETSEGIKYKGDWFPVLKIGFAVRTGDRTAKYK